jgi:hypothetical protein
MFKGAEPEKYKDVRKDAQCKAKAGIIGCVSMANTSELREGAHSLIVWKKEPCGGAQNLMDLRLGILVVKSFGKSGVPQTIKRHRFHIGE